MPKQYSHNEVDYYSMKFLQVWNKTTRKTVSMEFPIYRRLFAYLNPVLIATDRTSGKPLIAIFNREEAIAAVKNQRNLK